MYTSMTIATVVHFTQIKIKIKTVYPLPSHKASFFFHINYSRISPRRNGNGLVSRPRFRRVARGRVREPRPRLANG